MNINIWAVLLAALSTMVVGTIWYSPKVFGNTWTRLAKLNEHARRPMTGPMIATVIVSFLMSLVLAIVTDIGHRGLAGSTFLGVALLAGGLLWLGFTAGRFVTHDAFEGRPIALTALNVGLELVTIFIVALIIGVWPPAGTV